MSKAVFGITPEKMTEKAKKQIKYVILVGVVLIIIDLFCGLSAGNIELVKSGGKIFMLRPSAGQQTGHLYLKAEIQTEGGVVKKDVVVKLDPYHAEKGKKETASEEKMSAEEAIDYEIRTLIDSFNKDSSLRQIILPDKLESGEKITWKKDLQINTLAILICMLMLISVIYLKRFEPLQKLQKEREVSVLSSLPEFINRLVLLLNAGMVLNSAFEKTIEESRVFEAKNDYFSEKMEEMYLLVKNANGSMHQELRSFAKESGVKELMRISNIVSDNINKGVELAQKLQNENELLWIARKKSCEERGKLAETKLTLPLVIFLAVLIVVVVSPALIEL
jgi:hypothetical protein